MELFYPPTLIPYLKNKHLLLDTNVFIDAVTKTSLFADFFNILKSSDVTLTTIDLVKYELLKGSSNADKYKATEKNISDVVQVIIQISPKTYDLVYELIKEYGIDGTSPNITDLFLGATLKQYGKNICLLTKDTSDFMQNIFDLKFVLNIPHKKGITTYGIYQYKV